MPWHIARSAECPASKPFAVIKDADAQVEGCHTTQEAARKQMAALYANTQGKAELSSRTRGNLPDSAFACPEKRLYPHHSASGALDLAHLRNALSRIGDASNDQCGKAHLEAHARAEGIGGRGEAKAQPLEPDQMDAWYAGKIARAYRSIPFYGPIKGRDLDGEFFSPRTDPKPEFFDARPVLWHHGEDPTGRMGTTLLGKSTGFHREDDGWWEDVWLKAGEKRVALIKGLEARGATIYGSSQPLQYGLRKARNGEILVWPHAEYTLTTSPQNLWSAQRGAKAMLDDFDSAEIPVSAAVKAMLAELEHLSADLQPTSSRGKEAATAGLDVIARTLDAIEEAWRPT